MSNEFVGVLLILRKCMVQNAKLIVSYCTKLFPLHLKYQTRVKNHHHKCLVSDGGGLFTGISQRIREELLENHEKSVSMSGYRAEIILGCLLYADLSHASWRSSACLTVHVRSKPCRPLSSCVTNNHE
jgi:hypothetical protein